MYSLCATVYEPYGIRAYLLAEAHFAGSTARRMQESRCASFFQSSFFLYAKFALLVVGHNDRIYIWE